MLDNNLYINKSSQHALFLQNDATLYYGQVQHNHLQGQGTIIFPNGAFYIGNFHQSRPTKQGLFVHDELKLECKWEPSLSCTESEKQISFPEINDSTFETKQHKSYTFIGDKRKQGLGLVIHQDNKFHQQGDVRITIFFLSGLFERKQFNGLSVVTLKNKDQYMGNMKDGKFHGEGLFFKHKEDKSYRSRFENGKCVQILGSNPGTIRTRDIRKVFWEIGKDEKECGEYRLSWVQERIVGEYNQAKKCLESEYPDITQSCFHKKGYSQLMTSMQETKNSLMISDLQVSEQKVEEKDDDQISDDLKEYTRENFKEQVPMLAGNETNLETLRNVLVRLMDEHKSKSTRRQKDQGCQADLASESVEVKTQRPKYSIQKASVGKRQPHYLRKEYLSTSVTTRIGLTPSFITVRPICKPRY